MLILSKHLSPFTYVKVCNAQNYTFAIKVVLKNINNLSQFSLSHSCVKVSTKRKVINIKQADVQYLLEEEHPLVYWY